MRLLRIGDEPNLTLTFEEFEGEDVPRYAILSHRWYETQDEVTFKDVVKNRAEGKPGWEKIKGHAKVAKRHNINYCWVDTCCIDKRSSAELSEAINSMYGWYENAHECHVYLRDVPEKAWQASEWFSRGWTLQELLAPRTVIFYDSHWQNIGNKQRWERELAKVAGLDRSVFNKPATRFNAAEKMAWASKRKTTRVEDLAYCLLGLFGVNIPLLYGEGSRAFRRLQEEIIRQTDDDSIFLWRLDESRPQQLYCSALAPSPSVFLPCGKLVLPEDPLEARISITPYGMKLYLRLSPMDERQGLYKAHFSCQNDKGRVPGFWLLQVQSNEGYAENTKTNRFVRVRSNCLDWDEESSIIGKHAQSVLILDPQHSPLMMNNPDLTMSTWIYGDTLILKAFGRVHFRRPHSVNMRAQTGKRFGLRVQINDSNEALVVFGLNKFGYPWCQIVQVRPFVKAADSDDSARLKFEEYEAKDPDQLPNQDVHGNLNVRAQLTCFKRRVGVDAFIWSKNSGQRIWKKVR